MATDNSRKLEKIKLRQLALSMIDKQEINVLELFAGKGVLWNEIESKSSKTIRRTMIEKEKGKNLFAINADNLKILPRLDLNQFDIIDVDAYGIPFKQLEIIFRKRYKGIVIVTSISSELGNLPTELLQSYGFTEQMINEARILCSQSYESILFNWLAKKGVKNIEGYFFKKKFYFLFEII